VKLARLRYDQDGRRIAVVEFHRRSDAEYFMDRYRPEISFPLEDTRGQDSELITVGVDFNKSRDDSGPSRDQRRDEEGWDCLNCGIMNYPHRAACFKCKTERPEDDGYAQDFDPYARPILNGVTDEDPQQQPSQYLVVRDLEKSVTEEVLAKGVMKLFRDNIPEPAKGPSNTTFKLKSTAPTNSTAGLGAKPGSLRRVFLMRDRKRNESWRYGFAEFATVEDAMAAVAKFRALPNFTIASKPVAVAFIHTGVFVPAGPSDEPDFAFTPIYHPSIRLRYWDDRAYPSVLVVTKEPSPAPASPEKSTNDTTGTDNTPNRHLGAKRYKKEKEAVAGNKAIAMMPQMQMWAKKSAELHGAKKVALEKAGNGEHVKTSALDIAQPEDHSEEAQPDGPVNPHRTDQYLSYGDWDRVACLLCGWQVPSEQLIGDRGYSCYRREDILIDHEVRVHKRYEDAETKQKAAEKLAALGKEPRNIVRRTPRLKSETPAVYVSYADFDARRCLLCKRTFKHVQTLWRHEQESELHRRMLADPVNKERATEELKAKGKVALVTMVPNHKIRQRHQQDQQSQQQYRDRALERRQAFRQPMKPSTHQPPPGGLGRTSEKRKEPTAAVEHEEVPAAKKSKGAGMLAKMGWTAGAGLGAEGTGRTEAIATDAYAPGVGLGAEGGKLGDASEEAARKTRGHFSDFVEKTKDKARQRYESLQDEKKQ